jgi:hypothetical protein
LRSIVARLQGVPAMMDAMKQNIDNPPHEFTDLLFNGSGLGGFSKTAWEIGRKMRQDRHRFV